MPEISFAIVAAGKTTFIYNSLKLHGLISHVKIRVLGLLRHSFLLRLCRSGGIQSYKYINAVWSLLGCSSVEKVRRRLWEKGGGDNIMEWKHFKTTHLCTVGSNLGRMSEMGSNRLLTRLVKDRMPSLSTHGCAKIVSQAIETCPCEASKESWGWIFCCLACTVESFWTLNPIFFLNQRVPGPFVHFKRNQYSG